MAFFETLGATSTTLAVAWAFKKYIEPKLDHIHNKGIRVLSKKGKR